MKLVNLLKNEDFETAKKTRGKFLYFNSIFVKTNNFLQNLIFLAPNESNTLANEPNPLYKDSRIQFELKLKINIKLVHLRDL